MPADNSAPSSPEALPDRRAFIASAARWTAVLAFGSLASFAAACVPGGNHPFTGVEDPPDNSIKGAQQVDTKAWRLRVTGLVARPLSLTYGDVLALTPLAARSERMDCVEGFSTLLKREGVLVRDLLARAGVKPAAKTVIFRCHDGYTTSLPLPYFEGEAAMLVFRENGKALIGARGYPLELLATGKWGYKWAKWIETIELSADTSFRGYWESRGYTNSGDLDKPYYGT